MEHPQSFYLVSVKNLEKHQVKSVDRWPSKTI